MRANFKKGWRLLRETLAENPYIAGRRAARALLLTHLKDEMWLARGARPAPLAEAFTRAAKLPGYFNYDDALVFETLLTAQSLYGIRGDLFEIGAYHGRSTAFLARCLQPGETLLACDAFEEPPAYQRLITPSEALLRRNLKDVVPDLDTAQVDVIADYSTNVTFAPDRRLRFAHVDGDHSTEGALSDLRLCAGSMVPGGIIAVDDYQHLNWPEVTVAVDRFIAERADVGVLLDLSRQAGVGRKIYLRVGLP